jgi:hypothetical protein
MNNLRELTGGMTPEEIGEAISLAGQVVAFNSISDMASGLCSNGSTLAATKLNVQPLAAVDLDTGNIYRLSTLNYARTAEGDSSWSPSNDEDSFYLYNGTSYIASIITGSGRGGTTVTPDMFGGGQAGIELAFASGENVSSTSEEYQLSSSLTAPSTGVVSDLSLSGSSAENMRFNAGTADLTLNRLVMDCASGIALHQNQPNNRNILLLAARINAVSYALLSNNASDGSDGFIVAASYISSSSSDGVEWNHPDCNSSHYTLAANIIEGGPDGSSSSSGFGIGIAGTQGHVTALNQIRATRQEAIHIEDGQQRGVVLGNTGQTNKHGTLMLAPTNAEIEEGSVLTVSNHFEFVGADKSGKYGLYSVWNANGSISWPVYLANCANGFQMGMQAGSGHHVAMGNLFQNIDYGVASVKDSYVWGENFIRGGCDYFAKANNNFWCGKLTSDTQPSIALIHAAGSTNRVGTVMKGFCFPVLGAHTGSGTETLFETNVSLTSSNLMNGSICIMSSATLTNNMVYMADISWDGSVLTVTNQSRKHGGGTSSSQVFVSNGKLAFKCYADVTISDKFMVDFEGHYYQG